jgi:hypothetical protein
VRSSFAALLLNLLASRELSSRAFARQVGRTSGFITGVLKGRLGPSDDVEKWADVLGLEGDDRHGFLLLAGLTHSSEIVVDHVRRQGARIRELEAEITRLKGKPRSSRRRT